jgi:HAD superfamily hydrolase (TIGR01662 family)
MKAVFIDRDGTIGGGDEVTLPDNFKLYPFSLFSFHMLKENGYMLIAFTNQPDISKGKIDLEDFEDELSSFGFDDICICPHPPSDHCECRKPSTYMIEQMAKKYCLDLSECIVIGDRWSDMLAGLNAGAKTILVKTGAGNEALSTFSDKWHSNKAAYIAEDLLDAAQWIVQETLTAGNL